MSDIYRGQTHTKVSHQGGRYNFIIIFSGSPTMCNMSFFKVNLDTAGEFSVAKLDYRRVKDVLYCGLVITVAD